MKSWISRKRLLYERGGVMNHCLKCQGLVVAEWVRDEVAGSSCVMGRCLACGWLDDPVCRQNRVKGAAARPVRSNGVLKADGRHVLVFPQAVAGLVGARQPRRIYAEDLR